MLEALTGGVIVILTLIGLVTVIYMILLKIYVSGCDEKIILVLPDSEDDDATLNFACESMLRAYPLFSCEMFDVTTEKGLKDKAQSGYN